MSLSQTDIMNEIYNAGLNHAWSCSNVDGEQKINKRWSWSIKLCTGDTKVSRCCWKRSIISQIFTKEGLRSKRTV